MELPSVNEMYDALRSPVVPMEAVKEEERSEDMKTHTEILLDLIRSVQRIEDKLDAQSSRGTVQPDANLFGTTSLQLEM